MSTLSPLQINSIDKEIPLNLSRREEQFSLCKKIQPLVSALILKISACHDSQSVLSLPKDGSSVMFSHQDGENIFFRCWAKLIFTIPKSFLTWMEGDTPELLDFLIQDWKFLVNNEEISTQLWCDNPYLDTGVVLKWVPTTVDDILQEKKDKTLRWKWNRLVSTLLPPKARNESSNEMTPQWVQKLHRINTNRTITITIAKRAENWN